MAAVMAMAFVERNCNGAAGVTVCVFVLLKRTVLTAQRMKLISVCGANPLSVVRR